MAIDWSWFSPDSCDSNQEAGKIRGYNIAMVPQDDPVAKATNAESRKVIEGIT
jgi:hypothetical protein